MSSDPKAIGFAVYAACVDFMLQAARLTGTTYRDANALLFFVLWPAVTVALVLVVLWQGRALRRRAAARRRGGRCEDDGAPVSSAHGDRG